MWQQAAPLLEAVAEGLSRNMLVWDLSHPHSYLTCCTTLRIPGLSCMTGLGHRTCYLPLLLLLSCSPANGHQMLSDQLRLSTLARVCAGGTRCCPSGWQACRVAATHLTTPGMALCSSCGVICHHSSCGVMFHHSRLLCAQHNTALFQKHTPAQAPVRDSMSAKITM